MAAAAFAAEPVVVVAQGDGFVITTDDIEAQKEFFREKGFESNDKEHLNVAIKMRMFALEAKKLGLVSFDFEASGPSVKDMVDRYNKAAIIYMNHVMEHFPISDAAIETYYLAYPEKFLKERDPKGILEFVTPDDLMPLDENLRKQIRAHLVRFRRPEILENEFVRLKEVYHVSISRSAQG